MKIEEVAIVGTGPSGVAAAIQLKRYGVEPVVFEKNEIGGLLKNAYFIENYPGFPQGISGSSLVERLKKHLEVMKIPVRFERILDLEYCDDLFVLKTAKKELEVRAVIIASGTNPKKIPGKLLYNGAEETLIYEVYRVLGVKNKKFVIIGAGDAAFDYSLSLAQENEVVILNRSQKTRCLSLLKEKCMNSDQISYLQSISICKIRKEGNGMITEYMTDRSHEIKNIYSDYIIAAIGREPCLDFLSEETDNNLDVFLQKKKIFMIGDVKNGIFRQAGISAGEGIKAAMMLYEKNFRR